ncbi:acidic phospholipase A2 Cc1-PLA2-like [Saccoglossus kowalevskii]|uniref:Phospholipase A2 n=1 Tax=Saccoglossus kowalevskii TaxID=10224 RepID=A0ABM0GN12_SACKO|nr:PREDICTED: phospholipase A2 AP-PLA2-II-like [Saccoglossus kowalevskii]
MRFYLIVLLAAHCGCLLASPGVRVRRNLAQLGDMVTCMTDANIVGTVRDYVGYGCFCGFGGEGTPLDDTDKCCQEHDLCYDATVCGGLEQYGAWYDYETFNCDTDSAAIECKPADQYVDDDDALCKAALCQCDADIAMCFAKNQDTYNKDYRGYDNDLCT